MADLPPCDPEIRKQGQTVFVSHTISAVDTEKWVKKIAETSGQPVDWFYFGGRACILAMGDLDKVEEALKQHMPEHDALMKEAIRKLRIET